LPTVIVWIEGCTAKRKSITLECSKAWVIHVHTLESKKSSQWVEKKVWDRVRLTGTYWYKVLHGIAVQSCAASFSLNLSGLTHLILGLMLGYVWWTRCICTWWPCGATSSRPSDKELHHIHWYHVISRSYPKSQATSASNLCMSLIHFCISKQHFGTRSRSYHPDGRPAASEAAPPSASTPHCQTWQLHQVWYGIMVHL
jgi:hypothetical protein